MVEKYYLCLLLTRQLSLMVLEVLALAIQHDSDINEYLIQNSQ